MPAILSKQQLMDYFIAGGKPRSQWRIGTEHERFVYSRHDLKRLAYEGQQGIRALLNFWQNHFDWQAKEENDHLIALENKEKQQAITLEPGGQMELSGAPLRTLHDTFQEFLAHQKMLEVAGEELDLLFLSIGFEPLWSQAVMPWMPKERYRIMRRYMPLKGQRGLDMMTRTCTVQANFDYGDEADMIRKMRVAMALQPLVTAWFACSPFYEGQRSGYQSTRALSWQDTDPDRCGILPFVFSSHMGFDAYMEYLLDVPMYFIRRAGRLLNKAGQSFRAFLQGTLPGLEGEYPSIEDWEDHVTVAFPEVRLKNYIEVRGADCGPPEMLMALPAFWTGLLYDQSSLDRAADIISDWPTEAILLLHRQAPGLGLRALCQGQSLQVWGKIFLELAHQGLKRRAYLNVDSQDETIYLTPLYGISTTGKTMADRLLALYQEEWDEKVMPLFDCKPFVCGKNG